MAPHISSTPVVGGDDGDDGEEKDENSARCAGMKNPESSSAPPDTPEKKTLAASNETSRGSTSFTRSRTRSASASPSARVRPAGGPARVPQRRFSEGASTATPSRLVFPGSWLGK